MLPFSEIGQGREVLYIAPQHLNLTEEYLKS